jgi:hypothetical protein
MGSDPILGGALLGLGVAAASCARPVQAPAPQADAEPSVYLFSYFTRNGRRRVAPGVQRGRHQVDAAQRRPLLPAAAVTGGAVGLDGMDTTAALMRDPCVLRGPGRRLPLVWTISWTDKAIGVAHSRDLIHWSPQKRVPVMEHEPTTLNTWAPELFYDDETGQY